MTSLVIIESEAKAKALSEQSGDHETLLLRSAPMKVSHQPNAARLYAGETGFQFVPAEAEKEFIRCLLTNLQKDIYVALESDRQGEYWSWMLSRFVFAASKGQKGIRRIHVSGFAGDELAESFRRIEPVQDSAAASFYIRSLFNSCLLRHLARLLGTVKGPGGLPLHFAALTVLFLLEEREAGVDAFTAPAKWQVRARVATPTGIVMVRLQEAYEITDDGFFRDPAEVKKALALFAGLPLTVKGVGESPLTIEPPMPYRLAELLHDAYTMLAMGPARVLHTLQKLHAGLVIEGRQTGLISAPFSLIHFQHQASLSRIREEVAAVYGSGELIERQPDGHVILPLRPALTGDQLQEMLSEDERQLYELIRGRALASQLPAAGGRNLLLECAAGGCLFQGRSPWLTTRGFLKAFARGYEQYLSPHCPLQDLQAGRQITVEQVIPEQSGSAPVEYYTFASLSEDLAEFSLTLEPALLLMLQEMLDAGYLAIDAVGGFHMQDNTAKVVATLNRAFPSMKGINLSAYLEQTANEVISGRKPLDSALKQFEQVFVMHGVPLVRIQVPRAVTIREKKSKNIIKSPEPEKVRPGLGPEPDVEVADLPVIGASAPSLEQAVPQAPAVQLAAMTEAPAMEAEQRPPVSPRQAEPVTADAAPAADQPREEAEEVRISGREVISAQEMTGRDDVPARETAAGPAHLTARAGAATFARPDIAGEAVAGLAREGAAADLAEAQEAWQEAVFEEPPRPAAEDGQLVVEVLPAAAAVDSEPPAEGRQERACPDCGRQLLLKSDRFGRYWACSGYPDCRHAESYEAGQQKMELPCPLCGQESLVIKRTPTGKKFYVCPGEECEFMAWSRPHAITCPGCGSPFLVEKTTEAGQTVLRCPRAGCSHLQALAGEQPAGEAVATPVRKKVLVRRPAGGTGAGKKKVLVRRKKG
ncbi:MAG: DNA topoisomerase [Thermodesulfobacteriota bacterium]